MAAKEDPTETKIETNITQRFWWLPVFAVVFVISLLYAARANVTELYFDSKYYWTLSSVISENGPDPIYILRFPESVRGYFFPVLIGYFRLFFHGITGWRVLASLSLAVCFSLSLPYAVKGRGISSLKGSVRTLLAYVLFMWIWGGLMQYPLSDFIACFLLISAIALLRTIPKQQKTRLKILSGFVAGALLYAAYNTRTTYLYSIIVVLAAFILINRKKTRTVLITGLSVIFGMAVLSLPQCYINNHNEGKISPLVNYDLIDNEVFKGLTTARYETYIGDFEVYPRSGLIFDDLAGWQIVQRENISEENFELSRIFDLFLKYPLDMTGIYFRHLLSLLTPVYRQVYVTDITDFSVLTILVSIILWLTAGYGILIQIREQGISLNALWILSVCIPGLLQIFDEPELRFFLPLYLLCYYEVCAVLDWKKYLRALKANWLPVLILSLLITAFWISQTGDILAAKRNGALLFSSAPSLFTKIF